MKANLKASLAKSAKATPAPAAAPVAEPVHAPVYTSRSAPLKGDGRPHRAGKRMLGAHVDEGLYISVRKIAAGLGVTMQEVVHEAFSDLLLKHKEG
jgi:hypothetical protein